MTTLVTGGAGYIGSHTMKALKQAGHEVFIFDSLEKGHQEYVLPLAGEGHVVQGDTRNQTDLDTLFKSHQFDAILHFAAYIEAGESVENPEKYMANNVEGTANLLSAAAQHGVKQFVFSSTAAVYGVPKAVPIPESAALKPVNPYGESKLQAEKLIANWAMETGGKATILRYFNAAGADPSGQLGEDHQPETHLIPNLLRAAAGKQPSCSIFGSDYPTPDGTTIRDYIHVTDLAEAHLLALDQQEKQKERVEIYNVGTSQGYSVKEVIAMCEKITGRTIPIIMEDRRAGDTPILIADAQKIKKSLGWEAKHSDLATIVKTAWDWHNRL